MPFSIDSAAGRPGYLTQRSQLVFQATLIPAPASLQKDTKKEKKNHHNAKIVFSLRRYLCQSPKTADMGKAHTRHQETWPRKMYRLHYDRQAAVVPSYVTSQNRKPVVPIHAARSSNRCGEIRDLMTSINCRLHFHESSDTCELLTGSFSSPFAEIFDHFSLRTFAL